MRRFSSPRFRQGFGLAFDVERYADCVSGFQPAYANYGSGQALFGHRRLEGFAAALATNFVDRLCIVGRDEPRYAGEEIRIGSASIPINQAWAIREMLVHDLGADPRRVQWTGSEPGTLGNCREIAHAIDGKEAAATFVVLSSHYHLPRVYQNFENLGCRPSLMAAEVLWLVDTKNDEEQEWRKNELAMCLGGGPLAERLAEEINGLADDLLGRYISPDDAPS